MPERKSASRLVRATSWSEGSLRNVSWPRPANRDPPSAPLSAMPVLPSSTPATVISRVWNARIAPLSLAGSWDNVGLLLGERPLEGE